MAKPTLEATTIEAAITDSLGPVTEFAPMAEGQVSQAFRFRQGTEAFVVRVGHRAAGFHKDQWAARRVGATVPVPEVVHIGQIDDDHHFCVSHRLGGTIVQDCDEPTLRGLNAAIGTVLDGIAATDVSDIDGYGDFDPVAGKGGYDSWAAYIQRSAQHDWDEHAVDAAGAKRAGGWLGEAAAGLPDRHELVHGDFGADNVLVEPGRVTAVLDWEGAIIGDRLYDVARMRFWAPFVASMRVQADHLLARPHDRERLRCYVVATGLDAAAYFAAAGQAPVAQAMLHRTLSELD